ncbi:MAG: hypothetical protein ACKOAD_06700, partial [Gammaproteobacteria bacterium]
NAFRYNDAVIRHLILSKEEAITEASVMMKEKEYKDTKPHHGRRPYAPRDQVSSELAENTADEEDDAGAYEQVAAS